MESELSKFNLDNASASPIKLRQYILSLKPTIQSCLSKVLAILDNSCVLYYMKKATRIHCMLYNQEGLIREKFTKNLRFESCINIQGNLALNAFLC